MSSDWAFPSVPVELKSLAPYFQRAQELKVKDPVMSYWCTYYAAQQGIASKAQSKEARAFLFQVLSILEQMKVNLADNDAVTDDDAGAAYIENFALRVFSMADNEDRNDQATRSTAKKFLASTNFFELLRIFDRPTETEIEEKVRYAKWKAADLAKAFREGRKPIPGDVNAPVLPPPQSAAFEPLPEKAPSMSAWSPGPSIAPSPAVQGVHSLEPSPIPGVEVPLPPTVSDSSPRELKRPLTTGSPGKPSTPLQPDGGAPSTPSPRSFGGHLSLNHDTDGYMTPGMWSTMATPGTEDVYQANDAMGGISESPSARAAGPRRSAPVENMDEVPDVGQDVDTQDDVWSTAGNEPMSRQNSWTVIDTNTAPLVPEGETPPPPPPPPPPGIGLGLQPDGIPSTIPVKKVHFSPSVVGGLSSTSSSIAGSSPPASPGGYAPSLSTVPEATYSSDSEREFQSQDVAVGSSPQGAPPVIHKVISPAGPLSPNGLSSAHMPQVPPTLPPVPSSVLSTHPRVVGPPLPQFPAIPGQPAGLGSQPPTLHPLSQVIAAQTQGNDHIPLRSSPPPELTSTQIARIQKHCRFAISALDYEDAETARKELRSALAMLGG